MFNLLYFSFLIPYLTGVSKNVVWSNYTPTPYPIMTSIFLSLFKIVNC